MRLTLICLVGPPVSSSPCPAGASRAVYPGQAIANRQSRCIVFGAIYPQPGRQALDSYTQRRVIAAGMLQSSQGSEIGADGWCGRRSYCGEHLMPGTKSSMAIFCKILGTPMLYGRCTGMFDGTPILFGCGFRRTCSSGLGHGSVLASACAAPHVAKPIAIGRQMPGTPRAPSSLRPWASWLRC